ncbi:MAG: PIG-L deacetylase family protein [Acidimicrobiales bacterium]
MYELKTKPKSALAIFAHPDDADVACGGTLALWSSLGARVGLVVCTRGEKGTIDVDLKPDDLAEQRAAEVRSASRFLGVDELYLLELNDGEVENTVDLRSRLVGLVRRFRPEVVLTPDPTAVFFGEHIYNHRDHRELGYAVLDSIFPAAMLPHYFPDDQLPHRVTTALLAGALEPTCVVDISGSLELKIQAVTCHRSQLQGEAEAMDHVLRARASELGRRLGLRYCEAFRRISPAGTL